MNRLPSTVYRLQTRGFSLIELMVVMVIIGVLVTVGLGSFTSSQVKGRDNRRKADLRQISVALETYYNDFDRYPDDDGSGRLLGCGIGGVQACSWGGKFSNTSTTPETIYMVDLASDPSSSRMYYYNAQDFGVGYRLYAWLENTQDPDIIAPAIATDCDVSGGTACNYGIGSANVTP